MNHCRWVRVFALLFAWPSSAAGQVPYDSTQPPVVVVTGQGTVILPPDKATIEIVVTALDRSPVKASADHLGRTEAVVRALERLALAETTISRTGYSVRPYWDYQDREREFKGYLASLTVRVQTTNLEATGRLVGAALGAGATQVGRIAYESSVTDEGRRQPLRAAVTQARSDASAMAEAAGGRLGLLVLLTTEGLEPGPGVRVQAVTVEDRGVVSLTPEDITIQARVQGRWLFVSDSGGP